MITPTTPNKTAAATPPMIVIGGTQKVTTIRNRLDFAPIKSAMDEAFAKDAIAPKTVPHPIDLPTKLFIFAPDNLGFIYASSARHFDNHDPRRTKADKSSMSIKRTL
jgi:hypothetical protein